MGIFDLFKNKKDKKSTANNNTSTINDNNVCNFTLTLTEDEYKELANRQDGSDEIPNHLIDGHPPFGWFYANKEITDKLQEEYSYFFNLWYDSKKKSPKEQYGALKSFVIYMNDVQKFCYTKGECFVYWLGSLFDSEYLWERTTELKHLEENLQQLQKEYEYKQTLHTNIENRLLEIISNNDGIIQSEIYKMFEPSIKFDVSNILYHLNQDKKIERIKSGRSYSLHIKK